MGTAIIRRGLVAALLLACVVAPQAAAEHRADSGTTSAPSTLKNVQVKSHDGTLLDGWIALPAAAKRERVPVVLWSSPYFGAGWPAGDDPALWAGDPLYMPPVALLVERGYAVAMFNVRGTGNSGGCLTFFGRDEQKDQYRLVEWLGTRSWSNGNVGMVGLSYDGTTPLEAAIQNPPHLKTVVVAGIISDWYLFMHSPQGAGWLTADKARWQGIYTGDYSLLPPTYGTGIEDSTTEYAPVMPERVCTDTLEMLREYSSDVTDVRDKQYWTERRLVERFDEIEAAVFIAHGFQDLWWSGHQHQEDAVWETISAPKRMLLGQWGHHFPSHGIPARTGSDPDWETELIGWLDHWLRDRSGQAPGEGSVDYEDNRDNWHRSTAWPPRQARDEVLFLRRGKIAATPGAEKTTFTAMPHAEDFDATRGHWEELLCPDLPAETAVTYVTDPLKRSLEIAGNPLAYLKLSSTQSSGQVAVHLFDIPKGFDCETSRTGARALALGTADLRFHAGNLTGRDFPVGAPTHVRLDVTNLAEVILPERRLAVVVSYGEPFERGPSRMVWPEVTLLGGQDGSHLVLPVTRGSLGGKSPALEYPPRPFVPRG